MANPRFGTLVTEGGLAYSWSEHAHEFRLTPWSNDFVGATGGEALYLPDEISGQVSSPTAQPCGSSGASSGMSPAAYQTRHGFGHTAFPHHKANCIHSELSVFVDLEEPVTYSVLKVPNDSASTCFCSDVRQTQQLTC